MIWLVILLCFISVDCNETNKTDDKLIYTQIVSGNSIKLNTVKLYRCDIKCQLKLLLKIDHAPWGPDHSDNISKRPIQGQNPLARRFRAVNECKTEFIICEKCSLFREKNVF